MQKRIDIEAIGLNMDKVCANFAHTTVKSGELEENSVCSILEHIKLLSNVIQNREIALTADEAGQCFVVYVKFTL